MLDTGDRLAIDARKSGRTINGKEFQMVRRSFQQGCLIKRGKRNAVWVARWREPVMQSDGVIRRVQRAEVIAFVREIPTRRGARALLDRRLRELNQGAAKVRVVTSFGDFAKEWESNVLPAYRASTRRFYQDVLHRHLIPAFANWKLTDVRTPDVQAFLNQKAMQYAPVVPYHIRATLSRVFATAREWGYADNNPATGVKLPEKRVVQPRVAYRPEDVRRILDLLEEPYKAMALVDTLTGMRSSELFGLKWDDIDFERHLIHIRRTFYRGEFGPPKTRTSERAIPMCPMLVEALKHHRTRSKTNAMNLVFANSEGKPYEPSSIVRRALRPAMRELGLPEAGWRAFRRSVATAFSELREPVRTAQQVLGHSNPQTTLAIYTQTVEESQRQAMGRLEELLFPSVPKVGFADEGARKLAH